MVRKCSGDVEESKYAVGYEGTNVYLYVGGNWELSGGGKKTIYFSAEPECFYQKAGGDNGTSVFYSHAEEGWADLRGGNPGECLQKNAEHGDGAGGGIVSV